MRSRIIGSIDYLAYIEFVGDIRIVKKVSLLTKSIIGTWSILGYDGYQILGILSTDRIMLSSEVERDIFRLQHVSLMPDGSCITDDIDILYLERMRQRYESEIGDHPMKGEFMFSINQYERLVYIAYKGQRKFWYKDIDNYTGNYGLLTSRPICDKFSIYPWKGKYIIYSSHSRTHYLTYGTISVGYQGYIGYPLNESLFCHLILTDSMEYIMIRDKNGGVVSRIHLGTNGNRMYLCDIEQCVLILSSNNDLRLFNHNTLSITDIVTERT